MEFKIESEDAMVVDWTFRFGDIAIMFATLLGPILAVQAQQFVERRGEQTKRCVIVFRTLMMTRANTLSPSHVEALNMVPLEFHGKRKLRTDVVDAWKEYIDWLHTDDRKEPSRWTEKRVDLLNALLAKMGYALGYRFNSVEISRESYSPRAHVKIESDEAIIRQGLAKVFRGELCIPMDVKSVPFHSDLVQNHLDIQKALLDLLRGQGSPRVTTEVKN